MKNNITRVEIGIDLQPMFMDRQDILGNEMCAADIDYVVDFINKFDADEMLLTRDIHPAGDDYFKTREGKALPVAHGDENDESSQIVPVIMDAVNKKFGTDTDNVKIFKKPTFGSVELGEYLREKYDNGKNVEIYIYGVCTGICVINNVAIVRAFCPEAEIYLVNECCACVTKETHNTAIEAMKTFQVKVVDDMKTLF